MLRNLRVEEAGRRGALVAGIWVPNMGRGSRGQLDEQL